jgi:hypothetical protein
LIKFFDYCFTQDGLDLMNWGIEGQTYTRASDGTKQFMDVVLNNPMTPVGYLRSLGALYRVGTSQDGDYEIASWRRSQRKRRISMNLTLSGYLADERHTLMADLISNCFRKMRHTRRSCPPSALRGWKFQSWILGTGTLTKSILPSSKN